MLVPVRNQNVRQVPAQPVELGNGEPVARPRVPGQLAETGALECGDLRGCGRVGEKPYSFGAVGQPGLGEQVGLSLGALLVGGDPRVDQLDHGRNALRAPGCPSTPFCLSPNPVVNLDRMAMDLSRQLPRDPIGSTAALAACQLKRDRTTHEQA
jgi:hypothetical protein